MVQEMHVCQSIFYKFFWYKDTSFLHAIEHSSVPVQKLFRTWHEPCNVIAVAGELLPRDAL